MMCAMSPAMVVNCYNETWVWGKYLVKVTVPIFLFLFDSLELIFVVFPQVLLHVNSTLVRARYLDVHRFGP